MPNFMSELMRRANKPLLPQIGEGLGQHRRPDQQPG
jgi:hypothetical protein